jgi:hypothetical protein
LCEDCGAPLIDPFAADAQELPEAVWRYIRLQYGARRGMLVRVVAILAGGVTAVLLSRVAVVWPMPVAALGVVAAAAAGVLVWGLLHHLAGRAVKLWVLRRGQLSKQKLARALWRRVRP